MGKLLLKDVLSDWQSYSLESEIYLPHGAPRTLDTEVTVFTEQDSKRGRLVGGLEYLLGFEQLREQIEGFEEYFGRPLSLEERMIVVLHYADFDAPMDPKDLTKALEGGQASRDAN